MALPWLQRLIESTITCRTDREVVTRVYRSVCFASHVVKSRQSAIGPEGDVSMEPVVSEGRRLSENSCLKAAALRAATILPRPIERPPPGRSISSPSTVRASDRKVATIFVTEHDRVTPKIMGHNPARGSSCYNETPTTVGEWLAMGAPRCMRPKKTLSWKRTKMQPSQIVAEYQIFEI